jgi:hypothetical protein
VTVSTDRARQDTPLWPAGHLPLKQGGDWRFQRSARSCGVGDGRKSRNQLISPLEGEMSGRTEGVYQRDCHSRVGDAGLKIADISASHVPKRMLPCRLSKTATFSAA